MKTSVLAKITGLTAFSSAYLAQKLGDGFEGVIGAIVSLDPAGASEAQLNLMTADLEKAALKFATLSQDKQKELKEAEEAKTLYEKAKTAALTIKAKMDSETDPVKKASLAALVEKLILETQAKKSVWEKEQLEADNITKLVDLIETVVEQKFAAIESAKRALAAAKTKMDMADAQSQSFDMEQEIAAMQSGGTSTGLNVALNAMNEKADAAAAELAAKQKLASLKQSGDVMKDPTVLAALAEAEGKTELSLEDRLAAL